MTLSPLLAFVVAFGISSMMSVGGISGAFLLLPFQVSVLGFATPAVTPTNHLYNVVAIPSGVYRYFREGRMLWPLTAIIAAGTLPGVIIGSLIRIFLLPDARNFKLFMGFVLLLIGSRLVSKIVKGGEKVTSAASTPTHNPASTASTPTDNRSTDIEALRVNEVRLDWRQLQYRFQNKTYGVSVGWLAVVAALIGVIGGTYGIGGGAIMAPILVSLWNLPVHTIAGATLFSTFLTSVVGVGFFWLLGELVGMPGVSPNWMLGLSFGAGGLCGIYAGARLQRHLSARIIETMLALVVNGVGLAYVVGFWTAGTP